MHRLDLGLSSHPKEFGGNGARNHVNSKGKILCTGGSEEVRTRDAVSCRTASPTHYRLSCSGPQKKYDHHLVVSAHRTGRHPLTHRTGHLQLTHQTGHLPLIEQDIFHSLIEQDIFHSSNKTSSTHLYAWPAPQQTMTSEKPSGAHVSTTKCLSGVMVYRHVLVYISGPRNCAYVNKTSETQS